MTFVIDSELIQNRDVTIEKRSDETVLVDTDSDDVLARHTDDGWDLDVHEVASDAVTTESTVTEARPRVDVTAHGATGDGQTDDLDAIMDALDVAIVEKTPLYFPEGTYFIEGQIEHENTQGITLIGEGYHSVIQHNGEINDDDGEEGWDALAFDNCDDLTVKNLRVDGAYRENIEIDDSQAVTVENVWSDNAGQAPEGTSAHENGDGVDFDGVTDSTVSNVICRDCNGGSVHTSFDSANIQVERVIAIRCRASGRSLPAVDIHQATGSTISQSISIDSGSYGFGISEGNLEGVNGNSITDCVSINSAERGFFIGNAPGARLTNCYTSGAGIWGFRVTLTNSVSEGEYIIFDNCVSVGAGVDGFFVRYSKLTNCSVISPELQDQDGQSSFGAYTLGRRCVMRDCEAKDVDGNAIHIGGNSGESRILGFEWDKVTGTIVNDGAEDLYIKGDIGFDDISDGTRTSVNDRALNDGDPNTTGDWNGQESLAEKLNLTIVDENTGDAWVVTGGSYRQIVDTS